MLQTVTRMICLQLPLEETKVEEQRGPKELRLKMNDCSFAIPTWINPDLKVHDLPMVAKPALFLQSEKRSSLQLRLLRTRLKCEESEDDRIGVKIDRSGVIT